MVFARLSVLVPEALPRLLSMPILVLTAFILVAVSLPFYCSNHSAKMLSSAFTSSGTDATGESLLVAVQNIQRGNPL